MPRPRSAKAPKNEVRRLRAPHDLVPLAGCGYGNYRDSAAALAGEVIHYWLTTLVFQEALATRPKARRATNTSPTVINVEAPMAGQDYAKLPFAGAESFLLRGRVEHPIDLTSDWSGFFEHWLAARYRRGDDDNATRQLVSFPTLHLQQGDLAGLLRFPVETEWHSGDRPFVIPSYAQRQRGLWPSAPTRLLLKQTDDDADYILPFFVDAKILYETLRIDSERIDDFFTELRGKRQIKPPTLVRALCDLVEKQNLIEGHATAPPLHADSAQSPSEALLTRLVVLISQRLATVRSRARVYGVALVVCCDQNRTTWHLQKDLQEALAAFELGDVDTRSALHAYFSGLAPGTGTVTCWGRWRGAELTECQRAACQLSLGSKLAAVQGPPGTGKTTLILNLLAHTLVRKVTALAREGKMGRAITVVSSTNNRAVDNVVDPLGRDLEPQSLPLSFRVGSRQVIERISVAELERVRVWLSEQTTSELEARPLLNKELERFRQLRAALESRLAPEQIHQQKVERLRAIEAQLAELRPKLESARENPSRRLRAALRELAATPCAALQSQQLTADLTESGISQTAAANRRLSRTESGASDRLDPEPAIEAFLRDSSRHAPAAVQLAELAARLEDLSNLADGRRRSRLAEVKRHWKQIQKRALARVRVALGFEIFMTQPMLEIGSGALPDVLDAWEEAAESMLSGVREVEQLLLDGLEDAKTQAQFSALNTELAVLKKQTSAPPPTASSAEQTELEKLQFELFERAVRVREAWALTYRVELLNALERADRAIQTSRSLRSLVEEEGDVLRWLRELFPAWGCTLLSLGNVFPPEQDSIEMIVIDEAGQCHPAYAVAAMVRAQSTLIIGDTNQLEPVVGLSKDDEGRIVRGLELKMSLEQLAPFRIFDGSCVSAQSIADRCVPVRPTLVDHFRCQPEIAAICEALCHYGLVTRTSRRTRVDLASFLAGPVLHAATNGVQERFAGSWMNEVEARVAIQMVRDLLRSGVLPEEIGIITPYRGQLERLWRELRELRIPLERPTAEMLDPESGGRTRTTDRGLGVGTVHRFQGGERSIILFTTTVTEEHSLKFVDERVNLVNVAASRARDHLVTIGHSPTLKAGRHTRHLIEHAIPLR